MSGGGEALMITGAGGYLGARIARHCLERGDRALILWVHARDDEELAQKTARLREAIGPAAEAAIVRGGDLGSPEPFAGISPEDVGGIVHAAAATRFNVEAELAQRVNVDGAAKLYAFAGRCPDLERLLVLSSVYACGLADGEVAETPIARAPEFANHYERSKWEAERRLVEEHPSLPWSVLRVATVIAEDAGGTVAQMNAFHNTLKLLFYGLVSLIPGDRDTPLYFVTAELVADAVAAVLARGEPGAVYHACHAREDSLALGELVDTAIARFGEDPDFSARGILAPLFCDAATFTMLSQGIQTFGGDVVRQGLASITPFAAQLFSHKSFANGHLRAILDDYRAPDARELVRATCDYLVRTRWGARLEHAA